VRMRERVCVRESKKGRERGGEGRTDRQSKIVKDEINYISRIDLRESSNNSSSPHSCFDFERAFVDTDSDFRLSLR